MDKDQARQLVWEELRKVALPDSRFHFDFNEYIPDFAGSDTATERFVSSGFYKASQTIFITPDNCLEQLRAQAIRDGKTVIVSTYGIFRGFVEMMPADFPEDRLIEYLVLLDSMEKVGRNISLREIKKRHAVDLIVTGASAVSTSGVRFGKGHGYFDLEWAMLYEIGAVDVDTPAVSFVHDCQVVEEFLEASPFDTVCDYIVTPTKTISISDAQKPVGGVVWDKLRPGMLDNIPPLQELQVMSESNSER